MYGSFVGNLGRDAEIKNTKNGKTLVTFSVADSVYSNGKQDTQWINCVDFRSATAEKLMPYLKKGQQVFITGECSLNKYQANDGSERISLQCSVSSIKLCGSKKESNDSAPAKKTSAVATDPFADDDIPF